VADKTNRERAREAANRYAKMSPEEKCVFAGNMLRRRIYSHALAPDRYPELLAKRVAARPNQIAPWIADPEAHGGVRTWTAMGGRGAGKSWIATSWLMPEALSRPNMRIGVLGPDFGVSVRVGIKGPAGFQTRIEAFDPALVLRFDEVNKILYLANGSRIFCLSTENLKTLEGPEYHAYWADELAELRGQGGDNCVWRKRAEPGVRLIGDDGEPIRKLLTGTPEATPLIKDVWDSTQKYPSLYYWTQLATRDNTANLDEADVEQRYLEASDEHGNLNRYGLAKLEGHLILESPHALLNAEELAAVTVDPAEERHRTPEDMDVVILAVDANHADNKKSDECGIQVVGRRRRDDDPRIAHVFADASTSGGPKAWGERIIEALVAFPEIDEVVVEDDKSLVIDVVERVLRDQLQRIGRPIKVVPIQHGNRSKKKRADPVAVEYQLKHVLHDPSPRMPSWNLGMLEWQWSAWNPKDTGPKTKSPDRVDAAVYAITYLLLVGRAGDSFHVPGGG
jgi:phage terminase large subunit-like protein